LGSEEPNFLAHVFKSQYNLIGLGTALGFAVLSGSLLPIIVAAGAEMVLLPLISSSGLYQRAVRARLAHERSSRMAAQRQAETSEALQYLPDHERARFRTLQQMAADIKENYAGLDSSSRMLLDELVSKLDFLLAFYLRMRSSVGRYRQYFQTTDPAKMQRRIADLEREIAEAPERVKAVKQRTRSVLAKRMERYEKAHENQQLIEAQTETVVEVLQLLRDQSFAMTDPRTITEQLDTLVHSAEETEKGVRDLEAILSADQDFLAQDSMDSELATELEGMNALAASAVRMTPTREEISGKAGLRMPPPPSSRRNRQRH
jgi:hypothetical protein